MVELLWKVHKLIKLLWLEKQSESHWKMQLRCHLAFSWNCPQCCALFLQTNSFKFILESLSNDLTFIKINIQSIWLSMKILMTLLFFWRILKFNGAWSFPISLLNFSNNKYIWIWCKWFKISFVSSSEFAGFGRMVILNRLAHAVYSQSCWCNCSHFACEDIFFSHPQLNTAILWKYALILYGIVDWRRIAFILN